MKEEGPDSDSRNDTSQKRRKRKGGTSFTRTKQRQRIRELRRREASCEVGAIARSEPSKTGENEQGHAWRQHCKIRSLDLEAVDEAEASFDTMEGIQEARHSAKATESGDEGVQCTPNEFEDMEIEEGTVQNSLALVKLLKFFFLYGDTKEPFGNICCYFTIEIRMNFGVYDNSFGVKPFGTERHH